jgi:hypothetical protein
MTFLVQTGLRALVKVAGLQRVSKMVDAAEALFLGKGRQLTGTHRCLSLQGVGLQAF